MSNTPGISPITPDIEDIRRSERDDDDLIGGEDEAVSGAVEETDGNGGDAGSDPATRRSVKDGG